jgi:hypothetical protein
LYSTQYTLFDDKQIAVFPYSLSHLQFCYWMLHTFAPEQEY